MIDKIADKLPPHIFIDETKAFLRLHIRKYSGQWRISYEDWVGDNDIVIFNKKLSGAVKKMSEKLIVMKCK